MSDQQTPISEEDIHAYVDGTLSEERREEVERAIELNPALAARVSDYFSLNNMFHERYDRVLAEPVPARLRMPEKRRWMGAANWPQFAGMAAWTSAMLRATAAAACGIGPRPAAKRA